MERKTIALQLIKEDLRYHQFAAYLKKADLHLEYFPDLAPIVIQLIRPEIDEQTSESLMARYVKIVSIARTFESNALVDINRLSEKIHESLKNIDHP